MRRTQAAESFARDATVDWTTYDTPQQAAHLIQTSLIEAILAQGPARGLPPVERGTLRGFLEQRSRSELETPVPAERGGAGSGGVILVPGKDLPPGGVLVGDQEEKQDEPGSA